MPPAHGVRPYGTHYGAPPDFGPYARPPGPSFSRQVWPEASGAAPAAVLLGVAAVALGAGATLLETPGVQWPVLGAGVAGVAVAARSLRPPPAGDPGPPSGDPAPGTEADADGGRPLPRLGRGEAALGVLAVLLTAVAAFSADPGMITLCLFAAVGLAGAAAFGARNWPGILLTPPMTALNGLRSLAWATRGLVAVGGRPKSRSVNWPLVRGVLLALVVVWVAGALLASADDAFAGLLGAIFLDVDLDELPARLILAGLVAALTLTLACGAASPPRWVRIPPARPGRPAAEWLLPVSALAAVLVLFLAVTAVELFGALPDSLVHGDATPAERARKGFGELVVVTLIAIALLAWAGRRADPDRPRHRALLATSGGALLAGVLVVVASALRRMWLYESTFGWTVLRLDVAVFELWLGLVVLLLGVAWLLRRTAGVPQLVIGSAGVVLLVLGLAGPERLVATWNVDRFQATGKIDLYYLEGLSDDAVPALAGLPEPQRTCLLRNRDRTTPPWFAANVSRIRAASVLQALNLPPADREPCPDSGGSASR